MKKMLARLAVLCCLATGLTAQAADQPVPRHPHIYHHPVARPDHAYRHPHHPGRKHRHRPRKAVHPAPPPPPLPALRETVPVIPAPVVLPRPVTDSWQPYSYP